MRSLLIPLIFLLITVIIAFLNFLALMRLLPILVTLPLLFISIYLTLYSFFNRNIVKRVRQRY